MSMKMMAWVRGMVGLFLLSFLSACAESPRNIVKKSQADLNAKLDKVDAICEKVKVASNEKLASDKITLPAGAPPLEIGDIDLGNLAYKGTRNVQLFSAAELWSPLDSTAANGDMFSARTIVWKPVKMMVKNGQYPSNNKEAVQALESFLKWRYLAVLIIRSAQAPEASSGYTGGQVTDKRSSLTGNFSSGFVGGDVMLYDLQDGTFLGGFPILAKSSENIDFKIYSSDTKAAVQKQLDVDLIRQVRAATGAGFGKRCPVVSGRAGD